MENNTLIIKYLKEFAVDADEWFREATFLEERFDFFKEFFKEEHLLKLEWDEVQKLGDNLHCFATNALAKKRAFGNLNHSIEHYRESFHYLAFGGDEPRKRIDSLSDKNGKHRLKYISDSAISELISYIMPDKYTFFNSRSKKALMLLGIEVESKRKESLGDKFEYFSEAIKPVNNLYVEIVGKKTKLPLSFEIDQFFSFLYKNYKEEIEQNEIREEVNYWIFQGNPNVYDVTRSLNDNMVHEWWVKSYKDKINIGDKGVIWVTGKDSGCYAFFEVTTEIYDKGEDEEQKQYYHTEMKDHVGPKVGINIKRNITNAPVLKETVKDFDWFQNFNGGNQGTTFQMTKTQYEGLLSMVEELRTNDGLKERTLKLSKGNNNMKNQIFYGPPGTGKTMTILGLREKYTSKGQVDSRDDLIAKTVKSLSWWECIACVIADLGGWVKVAEIKDHQILKAKIEMQNNKSVNNTLWGQLQNHTSPDNKYVNTREDRRMEPFIFEKNKDSEWSLVKEWEEMIPDIKETVEKISEGELQGEDEERFKLVTFHPNFTYEDFILGIRPDTDDTEGIRYEKVPGKFKEICDMARKHKDKDFAIFIDEINRGNIPAIFGELITLIEEDKRGVLIDIPNSDEKFSVPENLWIYGTMNTADRSVESLDIALRRRFSFIPVYPDPSVLKNKMIGNINLQALLEKINDRVEFLKDKDHTIGHSYFLDIENLEQLKKCFENKVIPLLEEYFYNDFEKIGLVLGKAFVKNKDDHKKNKNFFADFDSDFIEDIEEYDVYEFSKIEDLSENDFLSIYEEK